MMELDFVGLYLVHYSTSVLCIKNPNLNTCIRIYDCMCYYVFVYLIAYVTMCLFM